MDNMDKYIGRVLDGRYEIKERIGSGGMAVVYKAMCNRLNRYVAVKILRDDYALDPDFRRSFRTESQAVGMLSHPNIVSVYDVGVSGDIEYIVMELIEGVTLKKYVEARGGRLGWMETLHFATQTVQAISHAHSRGIIHRDIKPHNIMVCTDGSVRVADFGIARVAGSPDGETSPAVGSVHYISPEQAKGAPGDQRSDIYSIGVVMYELLTGRLPYIGDTDKDIALQHVSGLLTNPRQLDPDIPVELEAIILKAMQPDPANRYQTAQELLADLEHFRKTKAAQPVAVAEREGDAGGEFLIDAAPIPETGAETAPDVKPLSRSGELSREAYARRSHRARKVSMLSGFFGVIVFAVSVFVFLWNFWLKDIFAEPERINIPNFVGSEKAEIIGNGDFDEIFNFTVTYIPDAEHPENMIVSQAPLSGKSMMLTAEGIDVELTVSSGVQLTAIKDVVNKEYREAMQTLLDQGFKVDIDSEVSENVAKDYVISVSPVAGTEVATGSTVYLTVSAGPEIVPVTMPNLVGLKQAYAEYQISSLNLSLGGVTLIESEFDKGTVIWQSISAYTEVAEHTKVYIQVSSGPKATPTPSPTPVPTPTAPLSPTEPVTPEASANAG